MAKFAQQESKPFDPIPSKLINSLAGPSVPPAEEQPASLPSDTSPSPSEESHRPAEIDGRRKRPRRTAEARRESEHRPQQGENERLTRVVKCLFTPTEDQELRNLVNRLREKTGISLNLSHLMRPFFELLLHSEHELAAELGKTGLRRPINDKTALAVFEHELAAVIHAALRQAEPLKGSKRA